jgi:hypothetical protein
MIDQARLGTYMQDHYAGSSAGIELFRRAADQQTDPVVRTVLTAMGEKVEHERTVLTKYMAFVDAKPDPVKNAGAWVAEKLGRFKPNGELVRRSPLSDVLELEMLRIAVEGKGAGWRVLRALADDEPLFDVAELDTLIADAEQQIKELEELRMETARRVFRRPA